MGVENEGLDLESFDADILELTTKMKEINAGIGAVAVDQTADIIPFTPPQKKAVDSSGYFQRSIFGPSYKPAS